MTLKNKIKKRVRQKLKHMKKAKATPVWNEENSLLRRDSED